MSRLIKGSLVVCFAAMGVAMTGCEKSAPTKTPEQIEAEIAEQAANDPALKAAMEAEAGETTAESGVSGPAGN